MAYKRSPLSLIKNSLSFYPWSYFLVFLSANTLLSYSSLPPQTELWVGIFGLLLPFGLGLYGVSEHRLKGGGKIPFETENLGPHPAFWMIFGILLLFTRFYRLTNLPFWPLTDEGIFFSMASSQMHHWKWDLLWGEIQFEPMMVWLLALVFKIFSPSLFSVRFLPAVVSLLTSWASYAAARRFFSRSTSILFCVFLTFSFWEFTLSRLCILVILVPLFQCLAFSRLGTFWRSQNPTGEWKNIILLGFVAGIGFYTWTNWVFVWFSLASLLLGHCWLNQRGIRNFVLFVGVSFLLVLPLAWARLQPGAIHHISQLLVFSPWRSLFLNLKGVLWDGSASFPYGSNWGGFLNPVLGSLVLVGILHAVQTAKRPLLMGTASLLIIYTLPGVLSNGVELYRLLPLLPLLMLLAAWGAGRLLQGKNSRVLQVGVLLLVLASLSLDTYNFAARYSDPGSYPLGRRWREVEYFNAYQRLEKLSRKDGPLYVFTEFNMDYDDKTLNPACYPFDALQNPSLGASRPSWAVLLCNIDYAPFLQKRFPDLKAELLNPALPPEDLHHSLGLLLIPAGEIPDGTLADWIKTHEVYREINLSVKDKNPIASWEQFLQALAPLREVSKNDPFLASIYWEKKASFQIMAADFSPLAQTFRSALREGYPAAHLQRNLVRAQEMVK